MEKLEGCQEECQEECQEDSQEEDSQDKEEIQEEDKVLKLMKLIDLYQINLYVC